MSENINEQQLKEEYAAMSNFELKQEFQNIVSIPNARTNIEALTKMTILMPEFESRGIELPKKAAQIRHEDQVYQQQHVESSGPNVGSIALGVLFIVGGLAATMSTDRIFYGAILVGIAVLIKGLVS